LEFKRLSYRNKNNKFLYYFKNYLKQLIPSLFFQKKLHFKLNKFEELTSNEKQELLSRLNYYNQLKEKYILSQDAQKLSEIKLQKNHKTYYFDLHEYGRYFNQHLKGHFLF